ncbi:GNAT family N-acetyltransferase [Globicatella sanguinis]
MKELETKRLRLRKLTEDDAPKIFNGWANDPEVTKYLTWEPHETIATTQAILTNWLVAYQDEQTVRYGIESKATDELMGMIDIVKFWDGSPVVGYVLGKQYWSQGYMTEAFAAVVAYLFELGYPKIFIEAEDVNIGSNSVIKKNAFEFIRQEERPRSETEARLVKINIYQKLNPTD